MRATLSVIFLLKNKNIMNDFVDKRNENPLLTFEFILPCNTFMCSINVYCIKKWMEIHTTDAKQLVAGFFFFFE